MPPEAALGGGPPKRPPSGAQIVAIAEGLEPSTRCLEGSCSIQLSYATVRSF